jgi:hypothetical protein
MITRSYSEPAIRSATRSKPILVAAILLAAAWAGVTVAGPIPSEHDRAELEARVAGRTRLRVTLASREVIAARSLFMNERGLLFHAAADTLERLVPWPEVAAIEAAFPMRLQSAFIGALVGGVVVIVGAARCDECGPVILALPGSALLGAAIGTIVGYDRVQWRRVYPLDRKDWDITSD